MNRIRLRALALTAVAVFAAVACGGGGGGGGSQELAADQTLRFAIINDVGDFDPGQISAAVDANILWRNVFSGLYKLDDQMKVVPDIAVGMPDVSTDGLTYTFHLKKNVKFSNGDPVKADDFIFSWNRAAARQGDYADIFKPVKGYQDVADKKSKALDLSKKDDYSFTATLSAPAPYWINAISLWTASVVDPKVVQQFGEDTWYTKPENLIGTGPYKLTSHNAKQDLTFEPVSGWWAGSTGALKKVQITVMEDQTSQVKKYEQGGFDMIGYGDDAVPAEDVLRIQAGPHRNEIRLLSQARTSWIGFNFQTGPFVGDAGKDGRKAFSMAIDRKQLIDVACAKGAICVAATGGVIAPGLKGYLGANTDTNTKFDAAAAKALYEKWDPDHSKVKDLKYTYNTASLNKAVAENLQSQWQANLGVKVELESMDRNSFFKARTKKSFTLFRHSWGADYDHPQDWYGFLFATNAGSSGSGYSNPKFDALIKQADQKPTDQAISDYNAAGKMLIDDVAYGALFHSVHSFMWKPYLRGVGSNPLYDYEWTEASIMKH